MKEKIYIASSWKNLYYPGILHALKSIEKYDIYDFRNPVPGNNGFNWKQIDPNWENWNPSDYIKALKHPIAKQGYDYDINALNTCDHCIYVLPCGRSASWELGYAMGKGKKGYVVMLDKDTPDLMFSEATIITSMFQLFDIFGEPNR